VSATAELKHLETKRLVVQIIFHGGLKVFRTFAFRPLFKNQVRLD